MKTLLIILLAILLTCCSKTVSQFHWEYANGVCKDHDGVFTVKVTTLDKFVTTCKNGKTNKIDIHKIKQARFKP